MARKPRPIATRKFLSLPRPDKTALITHYPPVLQDTPCAEQPCLFPCNRNRAVARTGTTCPLFPQRPRLGDLRWPQRGGYCIANKPRCGEEILLDALLYINYKNLMRGLMDCKIYTRHVCITKW